MLSAMLLEQLARYQSLMLLLSSCIRKYLYF